MATHELQMRIDRSVPYKRLPGFPRFVTWEDADTVETLDKHISVKLVLSDDLNEISSRWQDVYEYGLATEVDAEGNPVFNGFPQGQVDAGNSNLEYDLEIGRNYILVERTGGMVRDYRNGEVVKASAVWSKAKVSGYLIVDVKEG